MRHVLPDAAALTIEEMKDFVRNYYKGIRLELRLELESPERNDDYVAVLTYQISEMERLGPWLKEEA